MRRILEIECRDEIAAATVSFRLLMARRKSTKSESGKPGGDPNACDLLVVGAHPSASFAATLLARNSQLRIVQAHVPGEEMVDRLLMINPAMFELDDSLTDLPKRLDAAPTYGLRYLADDGATEGDYTSKAVGAYIAAMKSVVTEFDRLAHEAGVRVVSTDSLEVGEVSERGLAVMLGKGRTLHPKMLIVAGTLARSQQRALGLGDHADEAEIHRYSFIRCKGERGIALGDRPLIPMSLDLAGQLIWAWVLPGRGCVQFSVLQSREQAAALSPAAAMHRWLDTLVGHKVLPKKNLPDLSSLKTIDLPLAGALPREAVANRTLLIGPAGGFYTACAEELYPTIWSAIFAADVARKALKEKHLQDALQVYRQKWGSTLGDYLRGPQQNLRFLLPLIYRNKVMAARMGETILSGKGMVR